MSAERSKTINDAMIVLGTAMAACGMVGVAHLVRLPDPEMIDDPRVREASRIVRDAAVKANEIIGAVVKEKYPDYLPTPEHQFIVKGE
jgi:hypothetical protein